MQINKVEQIVRELEDADIIYIVGNGGSAALADHFACDLVKNRGVPAISLCSNSALITAIGNDLSFDEIFTDQLRVLLKSKKDLLFALSTRGNSPNIVLAAKLVNQMNCKVIGVAGYDGGQLKQHCSIFYQIDADNMQVCEDKMAELCHSIYASLFSRKGKERALNDVISR